MCLSTESWFLGGFCFFLMTAFLMQCLFLQVPNKSLLLSVSLFGEHQPSAYRGHNTVRPPQRETLLLSLFDSPLPECSVWIFDAREAKESLSSGSAPPALYTPPFSFGFLTFSLGISGIIFIIMEVWEE